MDESNFYTDEFIDRFGELLRKESDHAEQITICLSPECCGGWAKAKRAAKYSSVTF